MDNLARKEELSQPIMEYAHVLGEMDGAFLVQTSFGVIRALQAVGCLVRPAPGDKVLLSLTMTGGTGLTEITEEAYVLHVLSRDEGAPMTEIVLDGDVQVRVREGDLHLVAEKGMSLGAEESVQVAATGLAVDAEHGDVKIERLAWTSKLFNANIKILKTVGKSVEHVAARMTQRLVNSFRYVKDHDEHQAGAARHLVDETLTMHSKNAVHMADEVVKVDGEQVHLG